MKTKGIPILICVFAVMMAGSALSQTIVGSAHDFSGAGWNSSGEICITCHTPHNAMTTATPLWNHELSVATFTVYANAATFDGAATIGQPGGSSKLCLSCHDGTVALDNFGGATGGTNFATTGNLGTDLTNDHPISFDYTTALATADGELFDPSVKTTALGGTIAADMLFSDKLECASCHDVHNSVTSGNTHLLIVSNSASALCLTCHDK